VLTPTFAKLSEEVIKRHNSVDCWWQCFHGRRRTNGRRGTLHYKLLT
jgi:hypothetical protein